MYEFMMVISDQNINLILLSDIIQKDSEKVQYLNTFWFRQRLILKLESVFEGGKKLSFFLYPSNLSLLYWIDSKM